MQLKKNTLEKSYVVMTKILKRSTINAAPAEKVTCDVILLY